MNVAPVPISRISSQYKSSFLLSTLQNSQSKLILTGSQISTGQRLTQTSDDPAAAVGIIRLNQQLNQNTQTTNNLNFAQGFLATADSSLSTVSSLITQAQSIASSMVSSTNTADQRQAQATVIDSLISQAITQANTRYRGAAIFGGSNTVDDPFASVAGGYKYQGSTTGQYTLLGNGQTLDFGVNGNTVFGGQSAQTLGYQDLTPALTATTKLSDLQGQSYQGVTPGQLAITSGATTLNVNLTGAKNISDVTTQINTALSTAGLTATVTLSGDHLQINNTDGTVLTIADQIGSSMASNLGLNVTVPASTTQAAASVHPEVTLTTPLAALRNGAAVDPTGFVITNGQLSSTIQLSSLSTVQDLLNAVNGSGTQVHAEINAAGTGLNIVNALAGTQMTIGENGGTTAEELGIRSLHATTLVSDLNGGQGITPISASALAPKGSIVITKTDGTTFNVDLTGVTSTNDIIAKINSASGNTTVTAALNASGNGLTLTDTSGGAGNISVAAGSDFQLNGASLGLFATGSGNTLTTGNLTFTTDDLKVTRRDGTWFTVNLTGVKTVQDVLNAFNNAAGNTNPANHVTASLKSVGNGIQLSDPSTGTSSLQVAATNASSVAAQLGLDKTADPSTPGTLSGADVNGVAASGLLTALTTLRDALMQNDSTGIQKAANLLTRNSQSVLAYRGQIGARGQDVQSRLDQLTTDKNSLTQSKSLLADTDMTDAITKYQSLLTAYEGALKIANTTQNLSLLDFLS